MNRSDRISMREFVPAALLLALLAVLSVVSMVDKSATHDERNHYRYGVRVLRGQLDEPSLQRMPVTALNVLPAWVRDRLGGPSYLQSRVDPQSLFISRLPSIAVALALAWLVFVWARRLYGKTAAKIALVLCVLSPNILAHGRLATTDIYCAAASLLAVYSFREYLRRPGWLRLVASAAAMGLAQLTKQSALVLFPVLLVLWWLEHREELRPMSWPRLAGRAVVYTAIVVAVLNAGYGFQSTFALGVPLPQAYVEMTKIGMEINRTGAHHAPIYLLGQLDPLGFWYYFPVAFGLKTPLALLVLLVLGAAGPWRRRTSWREHRWVVLPALGFFAFFTLFASAQLGVRYLLPVLPFLYVCAGGLAASLATARSRVPRYLVALLLGWYALSTLSFHPHYLGYVNEAVGQRTNLYRYLADSNVDWGQNEIYLRRYLAAHAAESIAVNPPGPTTGKIAVSINELVGLTDGAESYAWLRDHYRPIDHVGYSWLIYDVPSQ